MQPGLLSRFIGSPIWTAGLSSERLATLFMRMGSPDPEASARLVLRGEQSLIGACMELLSDGEALSDEGFVRRVYRSLLGREPDPRGFQDYVQGLASGSTSRAEVVHSFLRSEEFRQLAGASEPASSVPATHVGLARAFAADLLLTLLYNRRLLPPLSMRRNVGEKFDDVSGEHFELTGRDFVEKLVRDTGLRPASRVLDVGAGCGRIAIPLTEVVSPSGCYCGIEAKRAMVRWCRRKITPRFPHFQFLHCDVRNKIYNPKGRVEPEAYRFPFDDGSFDLVVATSIFTHLLPEAAQNYIAECGRVLSPGGILFASFFLTEAGTRSADGELIFAHPVSPEALTANSTLPESAISYRLEWLLGVFGRSALRMRPPVRWGAWSGKTHSYSGQDVLIFQKR